MACRCGAVAVDERGPAKRERGRWVVCNMCARRAWHGRAKVPGAVKGAGGWLCEWCDSSPAGRWFREDAVNGERWGSLYGS